MDQLDIRIVRHLQDDGTATNAGIARQVGVSEETVRRRLKRLRSDGFIKVVAIPDAKRMGYETQIMIGLQVDADRVDAVTCELSLMVEVTWVSVTTGSFDVFAWATLKSQDMLHGFLTKRVGPIPGVRDMEAFLELEKMKEIHGIDMTAVTL